MISDDGGIGALDQRVIQRATRVEPVLGSIRQLNLTPGGIEVLFSPSNSGQGFRSYLIALIKLSYARYLIRCFQTRANDSPSTYAPPPHSNDFESIVNVRCQTWNGVGTLSEDEVLALLWSHYLDMVDELAVDDNCDHVCNSLYDFLRSPKEDGIPAAELAHALQERLNDALRSFELAVKSVPAAVRAAKDAYRVFSHTDVAVRRAAGYGKKSEAGSAGVASRTDPTQSLDFTTPHDESADDVWMADQLSRPAANASFIPSGGVKGGVPAGGVSGLGSNATSTSGAKKSIRLARQPSPAVSALPGAPVVARSGVGNGERTAPAPRVDTMAPAAETPLPSEVPPDDGHKALLDIVSGIRGEVLSGFETLTATAAKSREESTRALAAVERLAEEVR